MSALRIRPASAGGEGRFVSTPTISTTSRSSVLLTPRSSTSARTRTKARTKSATRTGRGRRGAGHLTSSQMDPSPGRRAGFAVRVLASLLASTHCPQQHPHPGAQQRKVAEHLDD